MKDLYISIIVFAICLVDILFYIKLSKKVDKNHNTVEDNFNYLVETANYNNKETIRFIEQVGVDFEKVNKRIDELQPKQKAEKKEKKQQPKPEPRTVGRPKKVKGE